ncbi:MAG: cytochrome c biogenesis protein CcdA, partial [Epulopiscium sp.]|nr:cytochrome c biogenesis protein CcdA [Candidatus Epulonipiscium sp.]
MLTPNLSMWMVLAEGVLSFLSPCVFPLIPAYLSYLAGTSIDEVQQNHNVHKTMIWNALGFVLGLSFVFISLGAGASLVGGFLFQQGEILR